MYRSPPTTPPAATPVASAVVSTVASGPRRWNAVALVSSFSTEAGVRRALAFHATSRRPASVSYAHAPDAPPADRASPATRLASAFLPAADARSAATATQAN